MEQAGNDLIKRDTVEGIHQDRTMLGAHGCVSMGTGLGYVDRMKFKVAISIEDGPLPYVLHVAVPYEGQFRAAKFRFKRLEEAIQLQAEYLQEYQSDRFMVHRFHVRKIRELHGRPYVRED